MDDESRRTFWTDASDLPAFAWPLEAPHPGSVAEAAAWGGDGVLCAVRQCSSDSMDSDNAEAPTFITLDHRLDDRRAWRIFRAIDAWAASLPAQARDGRSISSETLFGAPAAGGWFLSSQVGLAASDMTGERRWALIDDVGEAPARVTVVPLAAERMRIRARLRRRAARRR